MPNRRFSIGWVSERGRVIKQPEYLGDQPVDRIHPELMPSLCAPYEFQTCPSLIFDDEVPHCVPNNGENATRFGLTRGYRRQECVHFKKSEFLRVCLLP